MVVRTIAALLAAGLAVAGCSDSPTQPASATVTSVQVSGSAPAVGASLQFTAIASFSDGSTQDVTTKAAWLSSNTAIMTVSPAGIVTGVAAGSATLTATFQSVSGNNALTVTAVTCNFNIGPVRYNLPTAGGTVTIPVTMAGPPCAWDSELGKGHSAFMTLVSGATGFGNGSIVVNMSPNVQATREGSVIVSHRFVILFVQKQIDCVTRLTPNPAVVSAGNGYVIVSVEAPDWCTWEPSDLTRGAAVGGRTTSIGNGEFEFYVPMNGTGASRMVGGRVEHLQFDVTQSAPQGGTYFAFTSGAGDPMGNGKEVFSPAPTFPISATSATTNEAIFNITSHWPVPFGSATIPFVLEFRAPNGQPLAPGTYMNATGISGSSSLPYLNLRSPTRDCRPSGSFTVHEAVYAGTSIVRFFATFEQRCESAPSEWFRGEISFGR